MPREKYISVKKIWIYYLSILKQ